MKRQLFPPLLGLLLLALLLGACVSSLPVDAPAPTAAPEVPPVAEEDTSVLPGIDETTAVQETDASPVPLDAQQSISQTEEVAVAAASPTPSPTPSPIPPPPLPEALEPDNARYLALDYLRGVYLVKLPNSGSFNSVEANQDISSDVEIIATYSKTPWQVSIGDIQSQDNGATRTVIVVNENTGERWWGEVNGLGIVSTTAEVGFTTPDPERARGWVGQIVKLPEGSPHNDYFMSEGRGIHGIDSLDPAMLAELERYQDQPALVKVSGILLYGVDDYNGRQLLINQIEHRDGPMPDPLPHTASSSDSAADQPPTPTPFYGPTGALANALPGSTLRDSVSVSGQAEAVFENKVIVQIEDAEGAVLGQAITQLTPSDNGSGGAFTMDVAFENPPAPGKGRIALYAEDPADGSLMLLTWANIRLVRSTSDLEGTILTPAEGEVIKKAVKVRGVVAGLPNNEVLVQVEDLTGTYWGRSKTPTNSAGEFSKTVKFRHPATARPGLVAIYEINPIDNSLTLLAAQEVRLVK